MPTTLCPHPLRARYSLTLVGVTAVTLILTLTGCSGQDSAAPAPTIQTIPMSDLPTSSPEDQAETEIRQQYAAFLRVYAELDNMPEHEREPSLLPYANKKVREAAMIQAANNAVQERDFHGVPETKIRFIKVDLENGNAEFLNCSDTRNTYMTKQGSGERLNMKTGINSSLFFYSLDTTDNKWKVGKWEGDERACQENK